MSLPVYFRIVVIPALLFSHCAAHPEGSAKAQSASENFRIDHNRIFVELEFTRSDGAPRKALAFVDSGDPGFTFSRALFRQLHGEKAAQLHVLFAGIPLNVSAAVGAGPYSYGGMFTGMPVEANLPSTILEKYDVAIDYGNRTLTLARPGTMKFEGVRVPSRVDRKTGLISVETTIAGRNYAFAIDNGSAYTWIDRAVTKKWASSHPGWLRGLGAVGDANMNGSLPELTGMILRLPEVDLHGLKIVHVGALGVGPGWNASMPSFFKWYSRKTPGPVVGFLGGNVLRNFRLEIDYVHAETYWKRERAPNRSHLNQVGIIIRPTPDGEYFVMGVATQSGKQTVEGVAAGDRLLRVNGVAVTGATMGTVLRMLHGRPGETRKLEIERHETKFTVNVRVASF